MSHLQRHLRVKDEYEPSLKVAFASADLKTVDQHFGSCQSLVVYGVEPDGCDLLQVAEFQVLEGHSQDKLTSRIEVISDCFAVFCVAVGESVFRQLLAVGVRAIRVEPGTPIVQLIQQLQGQWPAQAAARKPRARNPDRFAELERAGWDDD